MGFRCCFGRRLSFVASIVYEKAVILPYPYFLHPHDVVIQYTSVVIIGTVVVRYQCQQLLCPAVMEFLIYQLEKNYNLRKKHSPRECYNKHFPQENIATFLAATVAAIS